MGQTGAVCIELLSLTQQGVCVCVYETEECVLIKIAVNSDNLSLACLHTYTCTSGMFAVNHVNYITRQTSNYTFG